MTRVVSQQGGSVLEQGSGPGGLARPRIGPDDPPGPAGLLGAAMRLPERLHAHERMQAGASSTIANKS